MLAIGAAAIAITGLFVALAPAGILLRHRIEQWKGDPGSVRLGVWKDTPALIATAPVLGSGPETFAGAFRKVESSELARAYPDFINESPHNILLDAASEEGLPGALILAAVFLLGLGTDDSPGLRAAMVSVFLCGLFASFSIVSAMYFWTIAGIASTTPAVSKSAMRSTNVLAIASPVAVAFIGLAVFLGAQDGAYALLGKAADANDLIAARRSFETATTFGFGLPGYELWASQQLARLKDWNDSGQAAALAEERGEDRAGATYQSSILRIVAQDAGGAEAKAAETIQLAPNWYKPHLLRAQILQAMGRNEEAAREAQVSLGLGWKGK
jgi:hypothetical protein